MFRKKKKKKDEDYLSGIGIKDEEIIDFSEFEEFEDEVKKSEDVDPEVLLRSFIFEVPGGCPICGGDVKGNDHYRFFCEHCNVLFDKKDIMEKEFGRSPAESGVRGVKRTKLTAEEREDLEKRRKELSDRIFRTFSEEKKEELVGQAEEESADEEDEPVETEEPGDVEKIVDEEPSEPEDEEPAEPVEADYEDVEEPDEEPDEDEGDGEPDEEETGPPREEFDLESPDTIIASSQSSKMHKGDCHFVKRIHPDNRIYLDSIEQGEEEGYELCVCLRRLKAMQR